MADEAKDDKETSVDELVELHADKTNAADDTVASSEPKADEDGKTATAATKTAPVVRARKPSFNSLRQEHDMLLFARSLMLIVAAGLLLIPIPFAYVGVKFVLFVFVAYAAIYNELSIGEEAKLRKDKTSAKAHGFAYVAFGAVTVLFFVLALRAGIAMNTAQDALQQCLDALKDAGLPAIVVK